MGSESKLPTSCVVVPAIRSCRPTCSARGRPTTDFICATCHKPIDSSRWGARPGERVEVSKGLLDSGGPKDQRRFHRIDGKKLRFPPAEMLGEGWLVASAFAIQAALYDAETARRHARARSKPHGYKCAGCGGKWKSGRRSSTTIATGRSRWGGICSRRQTSATLEVRAAHVITISAQSRGSAL